jgi:tetratricopeptide (TPR) repeat protein
VTARLLFAILFVVSGWQTAHDEFVQRIQRLAGEHSDTVMLYKQGQIDAALQRLSANTYDEQLAIVVDVYAVVRQKKAEMQALAGEAGASRRTPQGERAPHLTPPPPAALQRWTVDLMRAAGALQMEAAIMATRRHTASGYDDASRQIAVADMWFEKYTELSEQDNPARRWKLLIGLVMMSHGAFGRVLTLLDPECTKAPDDAALQIACGSAHEALAMFPGDLALATRASAKLVPQQELFDNSKLTGAKAVEFPVGAARASRESQLKKAQRAFEAALNADARNVEARLRLGNVLAMLGDDGRASSMLEPLLLEPVGSREAYLGRLLLSRVHVRAKRFDEAARTLEQAARAMPSGQSAYVGLAYVETERANTNAAGETLQRMLTAPQTPDDPWVTYRFGQYWVPDPLVRELRADVRQ